MIYHMDVQKYQVLSSYRAQPWPSSLGISLRAIYDISHGLAKCASLKILKSPIVLLSFQISRRATYDISHGLEENLKS